MKQVKQLLTVLFVGLLFVSCEKNKDVKQFALDFAEKVSKNQVDSVRALYPDISAISLARTTEVLTDTAITEAGKPLTMAVVSMAGGKRLDTEQMQRLAEWLEARVEADTLALVVR